jgi:hypothetical protein
MLPRLSRSTVIRLDFLTASITARLAWIVAWWPSATDAACHPAKLCRSEGALSAPSLFALIFRLRLQSGCKRPPKRALDALEIKAFARYINRTCTTVVRRPNQPRAAAKRLNLQGVSGARTTRQQEAQNPFRASKMPAAVRNLLIPSSLVKDEPTMGVQHGKTSAKRRRCSSGPGRAYRPFGRCHDLVRHDSFGGRLSLTLQRILKPALIRRRRRCAAFALWALPERRPPVELEGCRPVLKPSPLPWPASACPSS